MPTEIETELEEHGAMLARATAAFDAGKAQLLRQDGQPRYSPAEQEAITQALLSPLAELVQGAITASSQALQRANELEAVATNSDPFAALGGEDLVRAASLKGFVNDFVQAAPLAELEQRLRAVVHGGDKAANVLYQHAVTARLGALDPKRLQPSEIRTVGFIRETLAKLTPHDQQAAKAAAKALREQGVALGRRAREILAQADGSAEKAKQQQKQRLQAIF